MTLKQIRDQIIIDAMIAGDKMFPPARLDNMINQAQRYVQTELNGLGMKKWEKYATLTLSAGTWLTANDIKTAPVTNMTGLAESPKAIRFIQTSDGTTRGYARELQSKEFDENLRNSYMSPSVTFPIFSRDSNYVQIAPSGVTSAVAYYYGVITDLSDDADVSEMPDEFIEQVVKKVVLEVDVIRGKLEKKEQAIRQLNKDINDAFQKFLVKEQVAK